MNLPFDFECPECKTSVEIDVANSHDGQEVICPGCKGVILLSGQDWDDARKAVQKLEDQLKKLSR